MNDANEATQEKAVPRLLREVIDQSARLNKTAEELESRLLNGLRPVEPTPERCVEERADKAPVVCAYEAQLADAIGQLTRLETRLDDIIVRLEV